MEGLDLRWLSQLVAAFALPVSPERLAEAIGGTLAGRDDSGRLKMVLPGLSGYLVLEQAGGIAVVTGASALFERGTTTVRLSDLERILGSPRSRTKARDAVVGFEPEGAAGKVHVTALLFGSATTAGARVTKLTIFRVQ